MKKTPHFSVPIRCSRKLFCLRKRRGTRMVKSLELSCRQVSSGVTSPALSARCTKPPCDPTHEALRPCLRFRLRPPGTIPCVQFGSSLVVCQTLDDDRTVWLSYMPNVYSTGAYVSRCPCAVRTKATV